MSTSKEITSSLKPGQMQTAALMRNAAVEMGRHGYLPTLIIKDVGVNIELRFDGGVAALIDFQNLIGALDVPEHFPSTPKSIEGA